MSAAPVARFVGYTLDVRSNLLSRLAIIVLQSLRAVGAKS
jgi:hypothetical protein